MIHLLKRAVIRALGATDACRYLEKLRFAPAVTILSYHGIVARPLPLADWCFLTQSEFEKQLVYLNSQFEVLTLADAIKRIEQRQILKPAAVVTFDDGFQNNHDVALPVLEKLSIPATVFLATDFVDSADTVWYCRLNHALEKTTCQSLEWRKTTYSLLDAQKRSIASRQIQQELKDMPLARLHQEVACLFARLGVDPDLQLAKNSAFRMLDGRSIANMLSTGLIEFGAHTTSHSILSKLDRDSQRGEIESSIRRVEQAAGRSCRFFAYPNGGRQDYDETSVRILRANGIQAALTMIPGPNAKGANLMHLRRLGVGADMDLATFKVKAHNLL